ncbi:MAG TPA: glucose-6-phosphate dehydrogenase [Actinomycetota bacterium]|nr:glucose-6-phosphate dehydrogenase [Actinomycetota bacterium]
MTRAETSGLVPDNHVIVIFGANGDLARRKLLPALFHLEREGLMPDDYRIIGTSRSAVEDDDFRSLARAAVDEFCRCPAPGDTWEKFARRLSYASGDFSPGSTEILEKAVAAAEADVGEVGRLVYLAVPPAAFGPIAEGLAKSDLTDRARVVFEKPFGSDLESFRSLDAAVRAALDEDQVYRIDHFLGKEPVQNIMALRFANGMFEPVWHRDHIDHVQIDVPEAIGIGTRAGFYEDTGAFRDMVVTHLFQLLSMVAMEPPVSLSPRVIIDEKVKVFEAMLPLGGDDVVFGQYDNYRREQGVAPDSKAETFVAARVRIENWRWAGVPFFLRTGKCMAERRSAITLAFKRPPLMMFKEIADRRFAHDHLTLDLGPEEGISMTFLAKKPGPAIELAPARMEFSYEGHFGSELIEAYERLIHDALLGDRTLFTRADGIERAWEIVDPVLENPPKVQPYDGGSWGPAAADDLIAPRRWHLGS